MKQQDNFKLLALFGVFIIAAVAVTYFLVGGMKEQSLITTDAEGKPIGAWADKLVKLNLLTSDAYTGTDVAATAKVYEVKPADWGNPRGNFDDAVLFTQYTAAAGVVSIDKQFPGRHYVVLTATGYNTEFVEIIIPDGTGRNVDISDYNAAPDNIKASMALVGSTTDKDIAFALVNGTNVELSEQITLRVADNTEFRGWKAVIEDDIGLRTDSNNNGIYDEGISKLVLTIGGKRAIVFEPGRGVDEFDNLGKYTMSLDNVKVGSRKFLDVAVDMVANTEDGTSIAANDEKLSEGEGVIVNVFIYDNEGNLFATTAIEA
jgi:hypothetical protein